MSTASADQAHAKSRIYLDHAATTPCDPEVAEFMRQISISEFGNASSTHHTGAIASGLIERARDQIAFAINGLTEELIFTSGATESNNLVIQGVAKYAKDKGIKRHKIVCLAIEHASVLEPASSLNDVSIERVLAPVTSDGVVNFEQLETLLDSNVLLLCVQLANNEIGTIQPVAEAVELAHQRGVLVHCDAAQALGKIKIDVGELHADFLSVSAHKCYGPKGIGALWVSGGPRQSPLLPITHGGGQEFGFRPGTLNTAAIAGFGLAVQICESRLDGENKRLAGLREYLEDQLLKSELVVGVNALASKRLPSLTSIQFAIPAETVLTRLSEFDLSSTSACTSGAIVPSHVLLASGLTTGEAFRSVRIGLGFGTRKNDLSEFIDQLHTLNK